MSHDATKSVRTQSGHLAAQTQHQLFVFVQPLLVLLNLKLDVRLVRTFLSTLSAILQWRNRPHGLLLSELGGYLSTPDQAPAGTKRLSRLLHSENWSASLLKLFLWHQATQAVSSALAATEQPLVVWDTSVLEKPESLHSEGLCSVASQKARRLKRIRPGFFNPPTGRPICVAGLHWLALLVVSRAQPPVLAAQQWWTTRGVQARSAGLVLDQMLQRCAHQWGQSVWHIWDRGFANGVWLESVLELKLRFVLRWKKGQYLLDNWGERRKAWQITRGKRSWSYRLLRDPHTRKERKVGVLAVCVNHPEQAQPLWLVVARIGGGHEPWYLVTSEQVRNSEHAWQVVFAYARRWQVECSWRYCKSEMAVESVRLWSWERREKLLMLASLVYAFLLGLLEEQFAELRVALLRLGCHRTGKRSREVSTPLYRLRSALSRLWQSYPILTLSRL